MKCDWQRRYAEQKLTTAYHDMGELFLRFLDVSAGHVLHNNEKLQLGQKRLYKFYEQSAKGLNETLNYYAGTKDDDREAVDISLFVYQRRLKEIGVDLKALDAELADEYKDKMVGAAITRAMRRKTASRYDFLQRVELSAQAYHASMLWYLYEEYQFAAGRLPDIYRDLRRLYNEFCVAYINGTGYGDNVCRAMIDAFQQELEDIGILFTDNK